MPSRQDHEQRDPVAIPAPPVVSFIFEMGQLQKEMRNGWKRLGVQPESIAEHSLRAGQLAFILAQMEGHPRPHEVCTHAIFHDIAETRTGDQDKVHSEYVKSDEEGAVRDQTQPLGKTGDAILHMWRDVEGRATEAGCIAKDADYLEMAFRAKELISQGYPDAQLWIDGVRDSFQTESAKGLLVELEQADPHEWWKRVCGIV